MNGRYIWKRRNAMIARGKRIIMAHWRNYTVDGELIDDRHLAQWFTRNIGRYAMWQMGRSIQPQNVDGMQRKFWQDVIAELEAEHEIG